MGTCKAMNSIRHTAVFSQYAAPERGTRLIIIAVVITAHVAVFSAGKMQATANIDRHEMSVSIEMAAQAPQSSIPRQHQVAPAPMPIREKIAEAAPMAEPVATVTRPPEAAVIEITEPDYKAAYLNNPPPDYPMAARRMGLQGRVMLHVEVLANGICGQINIQKSSGYAMLDNAALQKVKTWRFSPASQLGRAVDKWFMIPVQFSLKDNA